MRVLVCGGAGYIGSIMAAMLAAEGFEPVVYDNLSKGHKAAIKGIEFVNGNLDDFQLLVVTLKRYEIEAVMHFAASIDVAESAEKPLSSFFASLAS